MGFEWGPYVAKHGSGSQAGPATHALILGVSVCGAKAKRRFGLSDLDCAVLGALRFAHWLNDSYRSGEGAPLGSLRVLLSPSATERQLVPAADLADVQPCRGECVMEAVDEWLADCDRADGNVALLYGAGHGLRYRGDGPVLLFQDFWDSVSVANSLDFPRSNLALDTLRLRSSLLFADCCQQIDESLELLDAGQPYAVPFDRTQPQRRAGWGVYRAATGGGSAYGERGTPTHFSLGLLDGLAGRAAAREEGEPWTITTDSLKIRLADLVTEHSKGSDQTVRPASEGKLGRFHVLDEDPEAQLAVSLDPETLAAITTGKLDLEGVDKGRFDFHDHPFRRTLPCGSYRVSVQADAETRFERNGMRDVPVRPYAGGAVEFRKLEDRA